MNSELIIPMSIYLLAVFGLAFYAKKVGDKAISKQKNGFLNEYLLGNRNMGGFVLAMTLAATYASASSFIGGPGAAYTFGLGWVLLAMIQVPAAWLTLGVLGKKFAIEARRHNALTLNDILYAQFKSRSVVIFTSLSLLLAFFGAMVVQFVGGARLLQSITGLSYQHGLFIFAATVGLYTCIGGFRAVALTDTVQGLMMIIGTVALLAGIIYSGGGLSEIITKLHHIDPALVSPYGQDNFISQPFILSFWVLVCFGVIGIPPIAMRCMTYQSSKALHKGIVISTAVVSFLMLGVHLSGALGRVIVPELTHSDQIMPVLMMTVLPPFVAGIFLAGPMAAIMSTVDSQLIQASATLLKDLYLNYINPKGIDDPEMEKKLPALSMWVTGIFLSLVFAASLNPPDMIIWLNLLAIGGMQAVFLWPLILGLYWKKATAAGALSSMVTGMFSYILLSHLKPDMAGMHAIVPTLALGFIVFVSVSLYQHKTNPKTEQALEQ